MTSLTPSQRLEEQKIAELMKPRYKLVADYPNSSFPLNTIVTTDSDLWKETNYRLASADVVNYPHLFKKLEWWEERRPEEMPEYVKFGEGVYRVDKFVILPYASYIETTEMKYGVIKHLHLTTPATSLDYEKFKTQTT